MLSACLCKCAHTVQLCILLLGIAGEEAVKAKNVFYYLTYTGMFDLDSISDPHLRKVSNFTVWRYMHTLLLYTITSVFTFMSMVTHHCRVWKNRSASLARHLPSC